MTIMCLDVGGTSIKAGICNQGNVKDFQEFNTNALLGGEAILQNMANIISIYKEKFEFQRIGISTTGQVDSHNGTILYANNNMPGYTGIRIKAVLEKEFGVPVAVENDVNSAALGELYYGAGKNVQDFVCLTYGTGVGGAIIINNRLYKGSSSLAGEFGGIIVHPEERDIAEDLYSGCYEKYASTTALVKKAMELDKTLCNGRVIFSRMQETKVRDLINNWIIEIIYGLVTITHMLNPSCIILGGGVMVQTYVVEEIMRLLNSQLIDVYRNVKIKSTILGNQAGLLGASVIHDVFSN